MPTIGEKNEGVIINHLLSKDKDKSLSHFKHLIDYNCTDSEGEALTDKKVRSRLDYLRKVLKEDRKAFLEICLLNKLTKDNVDLEKEYKELMTTTPTTPPEAATTKKRKMEVPVKKVKLEHSGNFVLEEGLPSDTKVLEYTGHVLVGDSIVVLPGIRLHGVKGANGGTTYWQGFLICYQTQVTEILENKVRVILKGYVARGRYVVLSTTAVPYGIFHDTDNFKKGLPDHLHTSLDNAKHKFANLQQKPVVKFIVIDFGENIPLSASVLHERGEDDEEMRMTLHQYTNENEAFKDIKRFNPPNEHWTIWEVARVDVEHTTEGDLEKPEDDKPKESLAFQLLCQDATPGLPPKVLPVPPPRPSSPPQLPPNIPLPSSPPKSPSQDSSSNPIPDSISLPSAFSATSSDASFSGTKDRAAMEAWMKTLDDKVTEISNVTAKDIIGEAEEELKRDSLSQPFENVHEVGGDGDTPMGSDRSHLKRNI